MLAFDDTPLTAVVVGAGIVGLATALRLTLAGLQVVVLEKERAAAQHQTGRNSGVIHAGPYYSPGSLKASLCVKGNASMKRFAHEFGIPCRTTGKLLLATSESEMTRLLTIAQRANQNGVPASLIGPGEIREREPFADGIGALFVETTGIVDYAAVSRELVNQIEIGGSRVLFGVNVEKIVDSPNAVVVEHASGQEQADLLVNAAGLYSDAVSRLAGFNPSVRIIPFRGEYFELRPEKRHLVTGLIYPVPDPNLPFLGVHLTKMISGEVHAGLNAVLALSREGYRWRDINFKQLAGTLGYRGFPRLAINNFVTGMREIYRSINKHKFASDLSRLVPGITADDLVRVDSGVRAQAVRPNGRLVDDFAFAARGRQLHVLNAPSPAATASLAIADHLVRSVLGLPEKQTRRGEWFLPVSNS